ncbi:MAG: DUF1858 domain-containing protein [Bacteroidales bacterium]|nr:DUF1858 domain-containing protein [Bacteroidales bacterium]MCF8386873.1 DUF1858 domain-containing protein [Bacteroidales bacterium]MCF8396560.1 DUF1858 domain-containing protein [Bacteroidales bacterium]
MSDKLIITPKTKVGELLKVYPELESKLVELAPEFKKLKNPVLRMTIARVTSLQQAARVGGIPVDRLVNSLRKEAGQADIEVEEKESIKAGPPDWLDEEKVKLSFDARPVIRNGGHPLEKVLKETKELEVGEIYLLISSFMPAPLIDKVMERGFDAWTDEQDGVFKNYFLKK